VTGLRIGSPNASKSPRISKRARLASTSTSKSIGTNSGSSLFGDIAENTHHMVAISSVSSPDMIFTSASRWRGSAFSSTTSWIVPLPSWTGPGK